MALRGGISKRFAIASWVLVALWACFIFSMSAHTGTDLSEGFFDQVKQFLKAAINSVIGYHEDPVSPFCHFCEYALFGLLLANALHCHMSWGKACLLAIACASAYGVTDEFHQLFVPGRTSDPMDWATDTCGAALGSLVYYALSTPRRRGDSGGGIDGRAGERGERGVPIGSVKGSAQAASSETESARGAETLRSGTLDAQGSAGAGKRAVEAPGYVSAANAPRGKEGLDDRSSTL